MVFVFQGAIDSDTTSRMVEELSVHVLLDEADEDGRVKILPIKVATDTCIKASRVSFSLLDERDCSLLGRTADGPSW